MVNSSRKTDLRRVLSACSRCRHHKIKCTGDSPCSNCIQRNASCRFEAEETKVQITRRRLSELNRRNRELEQENRTLQQRLSGTLNVAVTPEHSPRQSSPMNWLSAHSEHSLPKNGRDDDNISMVNILSCGPPEYITDTAGNPHYLGHTSTWSLTIRLLHLTHRALYKCPFPSAAHHTDSMTYDLQWNGLRSQAIPDVRGLPSLDHALFLINATKFHTGQLFHLFDEPTFMAHLYSFYENPKENINAEGLWLTHFLVILALGKAFVGVKNRGNTPPGAEFFRNAFMILPDYSFLWKDPFTSAELLCAFALYLQSIDWRTSAHNMIGQAVRILQVHGYHLNLSSRLTNEQDLERCQNVWWTVYILERQVSVLMGVPLAINDNDISALLPLVSGSSLRTATVAIHVKLSQALSQVVNTVYGGNRDVNTTFVQSTQEVLQRVANVASDLSEYFPVPEQEAMNGISRVSGYVNLLYHQCIMLATRPFWFILVDMCANSKDTRLEIPMPIKLLLQICLESAKKTVFILGALQGQDLLECFLPFDLESAVSAGLVILMASLVNHPLIESHASYLDTMLCVLNQMADRGNLIAVDHMTELNQLESLFASLKISTAQAIDFDQVHVQEQMSEEAGRASAAVTLDSELHIPGPEVEAETFRKTWIGEAKESSSWTREMSPSQLREVADMLNGDGLLDWIDLPGGILEFGNEGDQ